MTQARSDEPVYAIGVAAEMVASHPQTLRMYERVGLVQPRRTSGNVRLYSECDIERIRRIQTFTALGVNLAGIEVIFRLLEQIDELEQRVARQDQESWRRREQALTAQLREQLRQESRS